MFNDNNTFIGITQLGTTQGSYVVTGDSVVLTAKGTPHTITLDAQGNLVDGDYTFTKQSTPHEITIIGTWSSESASLSYTFNADGTFTITNSSTSLQGTYVLSGNSVTMTANGRTQTATLNTQGDLIEGEYTFKKQSS